MAVEIQEAGASARPTKYHFVSGSSLASVEEWAFGDQEVRSGHDQHKSNDRERQAPGRSKCVARCPMVVVELVVSLSHLFQIQSYAL